MRINTNTRREEIRQSQNGLLYGGVRFSAAGSMAAALVVLWIFGPVAGYVKAGAWFVLITTVYGLRSLDLLAYRRHERAGRLAGRARHWRWRVSTGAIASALAWAASLWFIHPQQSPAYEALLILMLGGVAGGALATLPYDRVLNNAFQLIILASVQVRLWSGFDQYTMELAIFSLFVFGFLLACGKEVGKSYHDLLCLRYDTAETNITIMKTTEEMARLGYWQWLLGSRDVELSDKLVELAGFEESTARVSRCYRLVHPEDRQRVRQQLTGAISGEQELAFEYRIRPRGADAYRNMKQVVKPIMDSQGRPSLIGTIQDVTDVKQAADRIFRMAYYDELTRLENRSRFHEHLDHHIGMARRSGKSLAVIYIDLDDFKSINDSFGHEHADGFLQAVAAHLAKSVRRTDHVARIGGDEFAVLIRDLDDPDVAKRTVERLLRFTKGTVSIGPHHVQPRLSMGVARFPADGTSTDQLLTRANIAMQHAKSDDDECVAFYAPEMEERRIERARLEADLRHALANDQFTLHYQPKINLEQDRMTGVEALIRWQHPERGMVPPGLFISTAERVGMISDIGDWVLRTACRQQARWKAIGLDFQVSINVSGEHFTRPGFVQRVAAVLEDNGLERGDLEIEITESLSRDPAEHGRVCRELRARGVAIAIDDFGTGYSSLSVLGDLEIDTIKIDRSFVMGLPECPTSKLMVKTIIELSNGLGYDLIAEGVETAEQLEFIRAAGCPNIQGYYLSRPLPADRIPALASVGWSRLRAA